MFIQRVLFSASTLLPVALSLHLCGAHAQTAPDADATSRANREAVNPLRMIIEASKLKVRIKPDAKPEGEAPPRRGGATTPVRAQAAASAPGAAAVPVVATNAAAVDGPAASVPAPPPKSSETLAPAAQPEPVAQRTEPAAAAAMAAPEAVAHPLAPLKLLQVVEPSERYSAVRRLHSEVEVVVDFTVNRDGSVSDVEIRSNPMKALDPAIIEAVSQWRYQPIAEKRQHAVQLVLRPQQ